MKLKSISILAAFVSSYAVAGNSYFNQTANGFSLDFNGENYRLVETELNGKTLKFRAYENIVYVANPVEPDYQAMNVYVPETYFQQGSINGYTADSAPIFLPNAVGGYMPAKPEAFDKKSRSGEPSTILFALEKGYVVASLGARGRTLEQNGKYTGKAPAAIVDLKAAVRYLHLNDSKMAGDANKIISNGTSAGGALSALLGASGDHDDYATELQAVGAATASDRIFAVSAYCPITNLEHADSAYEWQFNGLNQFSRVDMSRLNALTFNDRSQPLPRLEGDLTAEQISLSDQFKAQFPAYLNSLNLKDEQGNPLTLDENGNGSFKNYLLQKLIESANKALAKGTDLSDKTWLTKDQTGISNIDWHGFIHSEKRMKSPPAFDALDLSNGENNLFGTETVNNRHFTPFSLQNSSVKGEMADAETIKLMNVMNYLDNPNAAQHWRVRVGTSDRDTSHAISAILAVKLKTHGKNVDYALPWGIPHSGDYDLDELFDWIDGIAKP